MRREAEAKFLGEHGFLQRNDQQFHWHNDGYNTFDDFLATLNSRHRKAIKRERREALASGITIHRLTGADITEDAWDAFFEFYMETGSRKWGRPYLTRKFFSLIGESMSRDVLLVMAKRNGRWIAGAINFIGSDTLFGRNWGAVEHHPFLHFEVCYYQAIEFAIERGLKTVEAGAQGEHKLARGYLPQTTYSAHYIADPDLRRAIADYLKRERAYVAEVGRELTEAGPFRKARRRGLDPFCYRDDNETKREGKTPCPPMTPTTSSQRSCAANFPATRSMRTSMCWPSSTSCRARPAIRW